MLEPDARPAAVGLALSEWFGLVPEREQAMNTHEVWTEGYLTSGMEGISARAKLIGTVAAETFAEACDRICSSPEWQRDNGHYDSQRGTVWGCRLFNNATDARKSFG